MEYLILGFVTGLSLILAIGAQNIFVIEQGLKKQYIFIVCLVCSISDLILIFLGIFIFQFFSNYFNHVIELVFNIALIIFLIHFIYSKIKAYKTEVNFNTNFTSVTALNIFLKTLGFTYLNPHVYSDTVFFLGNFSKNFNVDQKIYFGLGASVASFLFFYLIGYLSKFFSKFANNYKVWRFINLFVITFMCGVIMFVIINITKA